MENLTLDIYNLKKIETGQYELIVPVENTIDMEFFLDNGLYLESVEYNIEFDAPDLPELANVFYFLKKDKPHDETIVALPFKTGQEIYVMGKDKEPSVFVKKIIVNKIVIVIENKKAITIVYDKFEHDYPSNQFQFLTNMNQVITNVRKGLHFD